MPDMEALNALLIVLGVAVVVVLNALVYLFVGYSIGYYITFGVGVAICYEVYLRFRKKQSVKSSG